MPDQTTPAPPAEYRSPFKPVGHAGPCQEFKVGGPAGSAQSSCGHHEEGARGCIQLERMLGRGWMVTAAPQRSSIALDLLVSSRVGLSIQSGNQLLILDQVLYEVTGYDALSCSLELELVEDYRPGAAQFAGPSGDQPAAEEATP